MPLFFRAYSEERGLFDVKKLFETQNQLLLKQYKQLRFDGSYTIEQIAEQSYACHNEQFRILMEAKKIDVQYLYDEGFLLECDSLQKFTIERITE